MEWGQAFSECLAYPTPGGGGASRWRHERTPNLLRSPEHSSNNT